MKKRKSQEKNSVHKQDTALSRAASLDDKIYLTLIDENGDLAVETHAFIAGNFRFNWNDSVDLTMVLRGNLKLCTEDGIYELGEDDFALINPNIGHAGLMQEIGTIVLVLLFSREFLERILGQVPLFDCICSSEKHNDPGMMKIRRYAARIFRELADRHTDIAGRIFIKAQILLLFSVLFSGYRKTGGMGPERISSDLQKKRGQAMTKYIDRHFREDLTLTELAREQEMNVSYLSIYFRRCTGLSFYEYLTCKRLEYAVYMLNNTDSNILSISEDAGFPNVKSFHSAFRKYLGMTPGQYRKELALRDRMNISSSFTLPYDHPFVEFKVAEYLRCGAEQAEPDVPQPPLPESFGKDKILIP